MMRDRFRRWHDVLVGYRTYLLAFVLALPDILDAFAGVDLSVILPPGWGAKAGVILAMMRIMVAATMRRLPPPADRDGGPR